MNLTPDVRYQPEETDPSLTVRMIVPSTLTSMWLTRGCHRYRVNSMLGVEGGELFLAVAVAAFRFPGR